MANARDSSQATNPVGPPGCEGLASRCVYDVGDVVATGGMGAILRARDGNCRRVVAMKVIKRGTTAQQEELLRFVEEAQITAQLEHPNIVPVHELGTDETGQPYYTMKLIQGATLRDVLKQLRDGDPATIAAYPLTKLLSIFLKACDAVAFAHARGVLHRDLKPENIMLGDFGEVLVLDWGLAKVLSTTGGAGVSPAPPPPPGARVSAPASSESSAGGDRRAPTPPATTTAAPVSSVRHDDPSGQYLTLQGMAMGTPQYMAPEQAYGKVNELDARTDIYALGAILYSILTLHPPVEGDNVQAVLLKVVRGEITPPSVYSAASTRRGKSPQEATAELRRAAAARARGQQPAPTTAPTLLLHLPGQRVPEALAAVAMKALATAPSGRYAAVPELQREVEAYLAGRATQAEHASAGRLLVLFVQRHRVAAAAIAGVFLALCLGLGLALHQRQRAVAAKVEAEANLARFQAEQTARQEDRLRAAPALVERGYKALHAKDCEGALKDATAAISFDPALARAYLLQGQVLVFQEQFAAGAQALNAYLARARDDANARELRALAADGASTGRSPVLNLKLASVYGRMGLTPLAATLAGSAAEYQEICRGQLTRGWHLPERSLQGGLKLEADGTMTFDTSRTGIPEREMIDTLEPLRGMPLSLLLMPTPNNGAKDLSPLAGMPLRHVDLGRCPITDLSPLAGVPLEHLDVQQSKIRDISMLATRRLRYLDIGGTAVSDIAVLQGAPLTVLHMFSCPVRDFTPLRGAPLEHLGLDQSLIADLTVLQGMPLRKLVISRTKVQDLTPLAGMPLRELDLVVNNVTNLAPLRGLPLEVLYLSQTYVANLEPLQGMPLTTLALTGCRNVRDLAPLADLPLTTLYLRRTPVADLSPLRRLPLELLELLECADVGSLRPLADCTRLQALHLPPVARDLESLRALPKLKSIGFSNKLVPAADFWRRYDEAKAKSLPWPPPEWLPAAPATPGG